jgi:hypothetical protein
MTDAEVAEITERLTRIERKLRRCRAALMGVALIAVAAAGRAAPSLLGAAEVPASIIRAKAFEVVDDAGAVRASLATGGGDVGLRLYDKAGSSRAALAMAGDGEGLGLYDKAGNSRAALATGGDDVRLELDDKAGKKRVALGNEKLKEPPYRLNRVAASFVSGSVQGKRESCLEGAVKGSCRDFAPAPHPHFWASPLSVRMGLQRVLTMKLKDHPKFPPKLLWVPLSLERKQGQHDPIKYLPEDMSQAIILDDVEPSLDRTGVVIHAKHPNGMAGTTILSVGDKKLASNLLQTAQKFREKRFEQLEQAEVTDEMLTA